MSSILNDYFGAVNTDSTKITEEQLGEAKTQVKDSLIEGVGLGPSEALITHFAAGGLQNINKILPSSNTLENAGIDAANFAADKLGTMFQGAGQYITNIAAKAKTLLPKFDSITEMKTPTEYQNFKMSTNSAPEDYGEFNGEIQSGFSQFIKSNMPKFEFNRPTFTKMTNEINSENFEPSELSTLSENTTTKIGSTMGERLGVNIGEKIGEEVGEDAAGAGLETAGVALDATGFGIIGGLALGIAGLGASLGELFGAKGPKIPVLPNIVGAPQMRVA